MFSGYNGIPFQVSDGDFDTNFWTDKFSSDDDTARVDVAGIESLVMDSTETYFNKTQEAKDFIIATEDDANLINIKGSRDTIGFGTANHELQINGLTVIPKVHVMDGAGDANISFVVRSASDVATQGAFMVAARSRGGDGSETVVLDGDRGLSFRSDYFDGTQFITGATLSSVVEGTPTTGNVGAGWDFFTNDGIGGGNTFKMGLTAAGWLGIGTAAPFAMLDVRGAAIFNFAKADNDFTVWGISGAAIFHDASVGRVRFGYTATGSLLEMWPNKTEWNRLFANIDYSIWGTDTSVPIFKMDAGENAVAFGGTSASFVRNGSTIISKCMMYKEDASLRNTNALHVASDTAALSSDQSFLRSRGTLASPTIVVDGDRLGTFRAEMYDGVDFNFAASIQFEADGTVAENITPGKVIIRTTTTAGLIDAATFDSTQRLQTHSGRIVNLTRVTTTYTILNTDHEVFGNTDGAGYTVTLPAGVEGQTFIIKNTGSSGNTLTVAPNGAEHLIGVNSTFALLDAEDLSITYNATDGWY